MPKSPVDMAVSIGGIKVILLGKGNSVSQAAVKWTFPLTLIN